MQQFGHATSGKGWCMGTSAYCRLRGALVVCCEWGGYEQELSGPVWQGAGAWQSALAWHRVLAKEVFAQAGPRCSLEWPLTATYGRDEMLVASRHWTQRWWPASVPMLGIGREAGTQDMRMQEPCQESGRL